VHTRYRAVLVAVAAMATVVTACAQPRPPMRSPIGPRTLPGPLWLVSGADVA
jgi:hypothetical protein